MRSYVAMVLTWAIAGYCFYNAYYGFRFPQKYIHAKWTIMRGMPREPDSAFVGAALSVLVGSGFFVGGLLILY